MATNLWETNTVNAKRIRDGAEDSQPVNVSMLTLCYFTCASLVTKEKRQNLVMFDDVFNLFHFASSSKKKINFLPKPYLMGIVIYRMKIYVSKMRV